jgi:hypothetical protein
MMEARGRVTESLWLQTVTAETLKSYCSHDSNADEPQLEHTHSELVRVHIVTRASALASAGA